MTKPFDRADGRPRVYISPNRDGATANWQVGPNGKAAFARTPGEGLDAALAHLGRVPAVIIWGDRDA